MSRHNALTETEGIHQPYNWVWQNAAERTALTAQDVSQEELLNKGIQLDTLVEYVLTDLTPTFVPISGGSSFEPVNDAVIAFTTGDIDVQLKTGANENPTKQYAILVWFSLSSTDPGQTATLIDDFEYNNGQEINVNESGIGAVGNFFFVLTDSVGNLNVSTTRSAAGTEYLWVQLPDGGIKVSSALSY